MIADIVVDLQYGDCGKGKVSHALCRQNDYTHIIRYNGGCNAGHTIYHEGKKFITHHIPCGVFFGVRSVIGPGCVVNINQLFREIEELESNGIEASKYLRIASNAHIITDFHLAEDRRDSDAVGTTKRGNGPAYRDKYSRKGIRAIQCPELAPYVVDMYTELHKNKQFKNVEVLFEGAQGFGLDVDWGDYPYVTSSHCTVGGAILNGVPPKSIRDVWGVAKIYETYVGAKRFQGKDDIFEVIREVGDEYGATTGRPRQINWLDFDLLNMAIDINGVNKLVINKMDILDEVQKWCLYSGLNIYEFSSREDIERWISDSLYDKDMDIMFSGNKASI